jgi:fructose-1,6-bisphosphatase II
MDRNLALEMVRVTEMAALASARTLGQGDVMASDRAAVDAMRKALSSLSVDGTVVIGEGERDQAPMLFIGEKVGRGSGSEAVDLALDPLEGTNLCAYGKAGAISVVALAARGCLLNAPDTYMEKICVGPRARGAVDLSRSPTENVHAVAAALGRSPSEVTVMIMERPRHAALVAEVRLAGARVRLIEEGDVAGCVATCFEASGVDMLMGIGGAPEGVISAAAVRCIQGDFQGRLRFRSDAEAQRARTMGVVDPDRIYTAEDLARGDVMFAATGVSSSDFLKGVRFFARGAETHSVVMRSRTGTVRFVTALHDLEKKPM